MRAQQTRQRAVQPPRLVTEEMLHQLRRPLRLSRVALGRCLGRIHRVTGRSETFGYHDATEGDDFALTACNCFERSSPAGVALNTGHSPATGRTSTVSPRLCASVGHCFAISTASASLST